MRNRNLLIAVLMALVLVAAYLAWAKLGHPQGESTAAASTATSPVQDFLDELPAPVGDPLVQAQPDDRVLGDADAKVTFIEYSSLSCPHCARHHAEVLPKLKESYIDTGKVKLILRDFPLNGPALQASLLAHCVSPLTYFSMVDRLYATQDQWLKENPLPELLAVAKSAGLDEAGFGKCQQDQALADRIVASRQKGEAAFKVDSTPTFIVNGIVFKGEHSVEQFSALFDRLLAQ